MTEEWNRTMRAHLDFPDVRELNSLQLAYLGDALHDVYFRGLLLSRGYRVGQMHKMATGRVSAHAQATVYQVLFDELTPEEQEVARRGRNAQSRHPVPRNQDPADYGMATGLEALWGYLYVTGQLERLQELLERSEQILGQNGIRKE